MCNALAGNLSPSLTACNTGPRWPCTRWLIGALLLLAFCPQAFIWEMVCWWPLGYWPPITVLGGLSPDFAAAWSVGGHLVSDNLSRSPRSICHLVHVSPCKWSTWLSSVDVIDYRWPTGSVSLENMKTSDFNSNNYTCFGCGEQGHIKADYPNKESNEKKSSHKEKKGKSRRAYIAWDENEVS